MRERFHRSFTAASASLCVQLNPSVVPCGASEEQCSACNCVPCACCLYTELVEYGQKAAESARCIKLDVAFYEQFGPGGIQLMKNLMETLPNDIGVILDSRRGDISNTATAYARAAFEYLGADAVTLSAYMGRDSIKPFLSFKESTVFVECRTSRHPTSLQSLVGSMQGQPQVPLFQHVANLTKQTAASTGDIGRIGLAMSVHQMEDTAAVASAMEILPSAPFLIEIPDLPESFNLIKQLARIGFRSTLKHLSDSAPFHIRSIMTSGINNKEASIIFSVASNNLSRIETYAKFIDDCFPTTSNSNESARPDLSATKK